MALIKCGPLHIVGWPLLLLPVIFSVSQVLLVTSGEQPDVHGPLFVTEPPSNVDFSNSTGVTVTCSASGHPAASVQWILRDDRPVGNLSGLRHVDTNGTLTFLPFRAEDYRQDVHATVYRCMATNTLGTVVSRNVRVRAVVNQVYEAQVYDDFVIKSNTAVLKCHIPSFVMDYVSVTSWLIDETVNVDSPIEAGNRHSLLPGGELHIRDVQPDDSRTYKCRTVHRLTGETKPSATAGRLLVTAPQGSVPPRLASHRPSIIAGQDSTVVVPCVAQGYPTPSYSWTKKLNKVRQIPLVFDGRVEQFGGSLIIRNANMQDSATYVCLVNNTVGIERVETTLLVTEPLSVYVHPARHIAQVGQPAVFSCSVSGHPVTFVRWTKNGRPLTLEQGTFGKPDVLRIPSAQKGDAGMYQCFAGNDAGSVQSASELRLGDAVPSIQAAFKEETVHAGADVSLRCSAYGNPSPAIEWMLDGDQLPPPPASAGRRRFTVGGYVSSDGDVVSLLNVSGAVAEDGGHYECTARNRVGSATHGARLNIYGPPFVRKMQRISSVAGKDIVVPCPYGGYPIESISWKKNGTMLPVDFRQEVASNGTLIIRHSQRGVDSGRYTCVVRNQMHDEAKEQVDIRIMTPPMIDPSTFQGHDINEGAHARIICGVTDGDLPITFSWLKDGRPIPLEAGGAVAVRSIDEFSSVMTINNVATTHSGRYTCVAKNAAAATNYTTDVQVRVPPRWQVEPTDAKLVVGDAVTLDCQADGFPPPAISWMKVVGNVPTGNRQELQNNTNILIFFNGSLHIWAAKSNDEGHYFCRASNGIGPGLSKMIYLNIRSPAKFDVRYRQQTARRGKDASLTCQAVGDAPLSFAWSKEEQDIEAGALPQRYRKEDRKIPNGAISVLSIETARREDSGIFKCKVKNEYGQDSASFHLMVIEPPDPPSRVKVVDYGSRKVTLSWAQQYDGNSPVLKYRIEGKLASDDWSKPLLLMATPKADSTADVDGLSPATKYTFRIFAENDVGNSLSGEAVSVVTEEEAPGGTPTDIDVRGIDSETLTVTWRPPVKSAWHGELLGYNVGYRTADSTKPFTFDTVDIGLKRDTTLSMDIKGLAKYTKYGVVVRVFNRVGPGPLSPEFIQTTAEDVPAQPPQSIVCQALTSESLQISWKPPPSYAVNGILQGYKVVYRPAEEWYEELQLETKITSSLRTNLHGLRKFTNYSVQVLAFTRIGDGVRSEHSFCRTQEDVPGPPAEIKVLALSADTILVTWKHPIGPNGVVTKYSVYVRSADEGREATSIESVAAGSTHYYARGVKEGKRYDFWVTASTSIGEGLSTSVVSQRVAGSVVSARVASFGEMFIVRQDKDIELPCLAVGTPAPSHQWTFREQTISNSDRYVIYKNGSIVIHNVISFDAGNYTCRIHNSHGTDTIMHVIAVQEPPMSPQIVLTTATSDSINIRWKLDSEGGIPLRGFILHFKRDFGEWEEIHVPPEQRDFSLEGLECGTRYHVYVSAKNDIGIGKPSQVASIKTEGTAPISPAKEKMLQESSTFLTLHLESWKNGAECPILYFVVEHKLLPNRNWTLVSNNVQPQQGQFVIPDLVPATWYSLKMTAHNTAGSTVALYNFATLTSGGGTVATIIAEMDDSDPGAFDWTFYLYLLLSVGAFVAVLIMIFLTICALKNRKRCRQTNTFQDEKLNKNVPYTACSIEKYEQTSTPTSFTFLMRNKDRPSSGSRQVSDTSTKERKAKSFTEELKTFSEQSPEHQPRCPKDVRDPRLDTMYIKARNTATLHPYRPNYGYPKLDDCHQVTSSNPEDDLVMEHMTESSLELHVSQGCVQDGCDDHGSSNETSPVSACSFDRRHIRLISLNHQRAIDAYNSKYAMDDCRIQQRPRLINGRTRYAVEEDVEDNENGPWFKEINRMDEKFYKHRSLEVNPIDSTC